MLNFIGTKILEFCLLRGLLPDRGNVLVAVSGGADSVALLHAFRGLRDKSSVGCDFFVGHINHNLRGSDSDGDEAFVKSFASELGFRCVTRSVDVSGYARANKLSIETAARDLRIQSLIEMAKEFDCDRIATAHHANDNAETVIHRMGRGTGFKGLCGINPKTVFTVNGSSATFVRPMLSATKEEIVAYCNECGIRWRHDHTNDEFDYTRNKIRHLLIPYLQEQSDGALVESLTKLSNSCQKLYEKIEREIEDHGQLFGQLSCDGISVDCKIMKRYSPIVQAEIIRLALVKVGCGQRDVTRKHYEKIISLLTGEGGKIIELPGGFSAKLELGKIVFSPPADSVDIAVNDEQKVEIEIPSTVEFGGFEIKAKMIDSADCDLGKFIAEKTGNVEWFDMDKIKGTIFVRRRKEGDKFVPIGMTGEKKIGKFLTASQVDYPIRKKMVVIEDNEKIIWVGPVRASERTRVSKSTKSILQIEIID